MNNGRFAISVHILTLLAKAETEVLSSEFLARSININPVLVRKEISNLRQAGLVSTKEGKNGGTYLARAPRQIRLSEVYELVRPPALLGLCKNAPNPHCPVGQQINQHLDQLYADADRALAEQLGTWSLADFVQKFG
ncbi:Rrf2 family transcriptional regulator [Rhabdobacter roseus]|uniref:Rrf2 family protein n=1 Tax=Rhabdobacter roseus TaxID=1655419 RepID=A0A840TWH3_9BACT|nr:Rrf2 family transcriptional regulator [Rhabdobacter roseus]MBB5284538.1 Rrf2 family protein [Rhabdobacter roseus]